MAPPKYLTFKNVTIPDSVRAFDRNIVLHDIRADRYKFPLNYEVIVKPADIAQSFV